MLQVLGVKVTTTTKTQIYSVRGFIKRNMGRVSGVSQKVLRIGKIIVLEEDSNFPDVPTSELTDFEYFPK